MSADKKKISVIIPCFNSKKELIERTIKSVYAQNYSNIELIIVDDGSDEEHKCFLKELNREYDFIILFEEHHGVSHARNAGTKLATGDYITYIDSDDFITNVFFNEAVSIINNTNVDYLIGGIIYTKDFDYNFKPKFNNDDVKFDVIIDNKQEFKQHILKSKFFKFKHIYFTGGPVARFIKQNLAKKTMFNEKIHRHEDAIWNLELIDNCISFAIVYSHWYTAYEYSSSSTRKFDKNMYIYQIDAFNEMVKHIDFNDDNQYYSYVLKVYSHLCSVYETYYKYLNKTEKKILIKNIYSDLPFKYIGDNRFFKLSDLKNKINCIFYKLRLFIFERKIMDVLHIFYKFKG